MILYRSQLTVTRKISSGSTSLNNLIVLAYTDNNGILGFLLCILFINFVKIFKRGTKFCLCVRAHKFMYKLILLSLNDLVTHCRQP